MLGKGDFKALLRWRLAIREEVKPIVATSIITDLFDLQLGLDVKTMDTEDITEHQEVAEVVDEEEDISNEVCDFHFQPSFSVF